jgi:hypothetical protein
MSLSRLVGYRPRSCNGYRACHWTQGSQVETRPRSKMHKKGLKFTAIEHKNNKGVDYIEPVDPLGASCGPQLRNTAVR